jgi:hypothetical protein
MERKAMAAATGDQEHGVIVELALQPPCPTARHTLLAPVAVTLLGCTLALTLFCHELSWFLGAKGVAKVRNDLKLHASGRLWSVRAHAALVAASRNPAAFSAWHPMPALVSSNGLLFQPVAPLRVASYWRFTAPHVVN